MHSSPNRIMKTRVTIVLYVILLAVGGSQRLAFAEDAKPAPKRILAAPSFPDSFDDRSSDEGELQTDLGPAKFQDMIAEHDGMTLSLRRFMVPPKTWELKTTKKMLDDAREQILRGDMTLKLKSEKDFTVDGFPGRSFIFTREGSKSVTRMDYFLLNPDLFIYYYSGPETGLGIEDVVKFFKGIKTMETKPKGNRGEPGGAVNDLPATPPDRH